MDEKKSAMVALAGRSNVGKSTLLNAIVGSKIAITTPKAQTTRVPIQGILTQDEGQLVFVDTPGLFHNRKQALTSVLNRAVEETIKGVDVVVLVADPTREFGNEDREIQRLVLAATAPKILAINKIDEPRKPYLEHCRDLGSQFDERIEISAKNGKNIKGLIALIFKHAPSGPYLYPEGQLTNMPQEIWLAELIREKLFLRLRQEVPYSMHVEVQQTAEREDGTLYIQADILTTDDRFKRIVIGKGGRGIKEIGQSTRRELEQAMQRKIYLDLEVKVDPHWIGRLMA